MSVDVSPISYTDFDSYLTDSDSDRRSVKHDKARMFRPTGMNPKRKRLISRTCNLAGKHASPPCLSDYQRLM